MVIPLLANQDLTPMLVMTNFTLYLKLGRSPEKDRNQ